MRNSLVKFLLVLMIASAFFDCARRGTPTGGLKDTIPPILIKAIPADQTVNFKEKQIKIYFDEYIKLKDVSKKLVISPPPKKDPILTPVGTASKFITIKIQDTLDANTTYAFNFGNSIVDNNEENKLENFKYVFSTGTYIDSLNLAGEVTDPMVKKIVKGIDVMLYEYNDSFTDSVIYKQKPRYIANTLDSTLFELTNLREGKYLLIALKDANNNKIYNPEIDKIGFIKDTIVLPTDQKYNFTIFKEIPKLKVFRPKEVSKGRIQFGFEGNANDLNIELLTQKPADFRSQIVFEKNKDTINYWYTPFEADSINFLVSKNDYSEKFTARIRITKIDSLKITQSAAGILHLIDTFSIATNTPIVNFDRSKINIINITEKDTTIVDFKETLSESKTKLTLNFDKKYNTEYNFELKAKAITDIFGVSNDSIVYKLKTKTPEDYGIINIDLSSTKNTPLIVELLNDKDVLIRLIKIDKPQKVSFNLLPPGNYGVRVTLDENNNGVWDTGSFLNKRQPEAVKYFDKKIELRANWDVNEAFSLD
ncbi:MAG: Ig-like domain-containing protein [Lutibacter sp.]|nr:Ig-like domain-containing protein [Lutibacter sp.]